MTETPSRGLAGELAHAFIRSKLTPLLILTSLLLGFFALLKLPREEEPQINVPMFDVFVPFPGAGAGEVEEQITRVGERKLWEIPGVEYIYSTSEPDSALFIVRFKVGIEPAKAMTQMYTKVFANLDLLPPGAGQPLIKPRSIDDVPILVMTLSGAGQDPLALRRAASLLQSEISSVPDVSETQIIGGHKRQFLVHFDPDRLALRRLSPFELIGRLQAANRRLPGGHYNQGKEAVLVQTDSFIKSVGDLKKIVVGVSRGGPVYLNDVAQVSDAEDENESDVAITLKDSPGAASAVTLAVSKRRGANATTVSRAVLGLVDKVRQTSLPKGMNIAVTRDYGQTAKEKSDELLFHMLLATLSVTLLISVVLGAREGVVVLVAIPVTLALTLLIYFLAGYTLNRITLFALIFSIGILVDDAIVVVENIHRHFAMGDGRPLWSLAVEAVAEVGNPTFLATWAVIAAILPMAFVSGLMGPYMRPIPVGASMAMLFSLAVAFIVSPWIFTHLLEVWKPTHCPNPNAESALDRAYRRAMRALLQNASVRAAYFAGMLILLGGSLCFVLLKWVTVKMLPFDNKDEFEIVLTLPEKSNFEETKKAAGEMAEYLSKTPEVREITRYVGAAAPYNFNGLVRHYFLRQRPNQADIMVHLSGRKGRSRQSHDIAKAIREPMRIIAEKYGARVQVAEVPPGPPVLSTLVFEIYSADEEERNRLAASIRSLLIHTEGVADVDTYVPTPAPMDRLMVDREKATLNGIPPSSIVDSVSAALEGITVDLAHISDEREPVEIRLRLPEPMRRSLDAVSAIRLFTANGTPVAIKDLTQRVRLDADPPVYHKNLERAAYVIADVAGRQESPIYAILKLKDRIQGMRTKSGLPLAQYFTSQPGPFETAIKWDGEWQITYEVFRDLGIAFAMVLFLMYILIVAWFRSFSIPLVIMAPIPLTLVGILPAHWLLGAFFTATSMIGFIAGAGIVVRNSIILVDFIQLRRREGLSLEDAVIDAGAVRFRPMLLTAAAVVVGAAVILFDPIFQGLAVSLMAGEVASTLLSRTAVPVLYFIMARSGIIKEPAAS